MRESNNGLLAMARSQQLINVASSIPTFRPPAPPPIDTSPWRDGLLSSIAALQVTQPAVLADVGRATARMVAQAAAPIDFSKLVPQSITFGIDTSALRKSIESMTKSIATQNSGLLEALQRNTVAQFAASMPSFYSELDLGLARWLPTFRIPPVPERGTEVGDLLTLIWHGASGDEQMPALERVAGRIAWSPKGVAFTALAAQAAARQLRLDAIKREVLMDAVALATGAGGQRQRLAIARAVPIQDGYIQPHDTPGIGFERKAELFAVMKQLSP